MIDITKDIQPLTTFRNNSVEFMQQLKATQRPIVLTVNGKPEAVVQDAAAYQRLLNIAAKANEEEAIFQVLDDVANGRTRPAKQVFDELRKKHRIPR
jgi:prevent-host-death family protein